MKYFISLLLFLPLWCSAQEPLTIFEKSNGTQTATYDEIIHWWTTLDSISDIVSMVEVGTTDAEKPLHIALISSQKPKQLNELKNSPSVTILINNGIHPGEPDGIDASMILARKIVTGEFNLPNNISLAILPVYNIGGALNRGPNFRVDQNGPAEFGFRGNSQNLDLNRDFIKNDSKESLSFANIFQTIDPDIFIDNHVSNGADYQHVMTLIASQHNRLGGSMGEFLNNVFEPSIFKTMDSLGLPLIPYLNSFNGQVKDGWPQFWDSPRYSTGYASLWNTFSFMPETHMLKPYPQRVAATRILMESFIDFASKHASQIKRLRKEAKQKTMELENLTIKWELDSSKHEFRTLKGYESEQKKSEVSGLPRLYYNRSKPYTISVPFYSQYKPTKYVKAPKAYIIPHGWAKVINSLKANHVKMSQLQYDTTLLVESYMIENYVASERPFEGHYVNREIQLKKKSEKRKFSKGDWWIPMNQEANRYLMEVLEPEAEDSFFSWNFFDAILQQKEGYSAYAFEDIAADFLKQNPNVRDLLEKEKQSDPEFAKNASAQLRFVYDHSPWRESAFKTYPVYRVVSIP